MFIWGGSREGEWRGAEGIPKPYAPSSQLCSETKLLKKKKNSPFKRVRVGGRHRVRYNEKKRGHKQVNQNIKEHLVVRITDFYFPHQFLITTLYLNSHTLVYLWTAPSVAVICQSPSAPITHFKSYLCLVIFFSCCRASSPFPLFSFFSEMYCQFSFVYSFS